jgi:hypothetical protein
MAHTFKNTSEHLTTMMSIAARRLAGSTSAVSHSANAARNVSRRFMSVINLSDDEAVKKFRAINNKSVLYFTASCKYSIQDCRLLCVVRSYFINKIYGTEGYITVFDACQSLT